MTGDPIQAGFLLKVGLGTQISPSFEVAEVLMDTAGTTFWAVVRSITNPHDTGLTDVMPYGDGSQARLGLHPNATLSLMVRSTPVTLNTSHLIGKGNLFKLKSGRGLSAQPDEVKGGVIGFFRKSSSGVMNKLKKSGANLVKGDVDEGTVVPSPSIFDADRNTFGNGMITFHFTPYTYKDKATITFGGLHQGTVRNDYTWINVEQSVLDGKPNASTSLVYSNHWTFKCGMKYGNVLLNQSLDVILDSGCPCIELPVPVFNIYQTEVKKNCPSVKSFSNKLSGTLTILKSEVANLQLLKLHIGNRDFENIGDAQIWPVALKVSEDRVLLRVKKLPAKHTMALVGLPSCIFSSPFVVCLCFH